MMRLVVVLAILAMAGLIVRGVDGGECPTLGCKHETWSSWTRSTAPCEGTIYRRQMCSCPTGGCEIGIKDEQCVGEPVIELAAYSEPVGCCRWGWASASLDEEMCNEQSCGIVGQKWRRQKCYCNQNGLDVLMGDEYCSFRGPPQEESKDCVTPCCVTTQDTYCPRDIAAPLNDCLREWTTTVCHCQGGSTPPLFSSSCLIEPFDNPYSVSPRPCTTVTETTGCHVLAPDGSSDCFTHSPTSIQPEPCSSEFPIAPNCYQNTFYTTECHGSCALNSSGIGKQWRIPNKNPTESCFVPPPSTVVECDLDCCRLGDWSSWSQCDNPNGPGQQWRYRPCTCMAEEGLCPFVPIEIQNCTGTPPCSWKQDSHFTRCGGNTSEATGIHYGTPICHCGDTPSGICDISQCAGPIPITSSPCTVPSCVDCIWSQIKSSCNGSCLPFPPPYREDNSNGNSSNSNGNSNSNIQLPTNATGLFTSSHVCTCSGVISTDAACSAAKPTDTYATCTIDCPVCGWNEWMPWSSCSQICGSGVRTRSHTCNCTSIDFPDNGNSYCKGVRTQTEGCNKQACPSPRTVEQWISSQSWPTGAQESTLPCTTNTWRQQIANKNNVWDRLAAEYIAARLNVMVGVPPSRLVDTALTNALSYLSVCYSSDWETSSIAGKSLATTSTLHYFNQGEKGFLAYGMGDSNTYDLVPSNEHSSSSVALIVAPSIVSGILLIIIVIGITHWYQNKKRSVITSDVRSPPGTPSRKV